MDYEEIKQKKKMRNIRSQLIGMAVLKTAKDSDVHIHYLNDGMYNIAQPSDPQPSMPQEKFTMSRDEFKEVMLKKMLEEQS
jgi:peroxiredoxin family protein